MLTEKQKRALDLGRQKGLIRKRPTGLKYNLLKENPTSFKKGFTPWNSGKSQPYFDSSTGYMKIRARGKEIKYHRYIFEQSIGRELLPTEIIHHIDHNKMNNDIGNLKMMSRSEHMKHHWRTDRRKS